MTSFVKESQTRAAPSLCWRRVRRTEPGIDLGQFVPDVTEVDDLGLGGPDPHKVLLIGGYVESQNFDLVGKARLAEVPGAFPAVAGIGRTIDQRHIGPLLLRHQEKTWPDGAGADDFGASRFKVSFELIPGLTLGLDDHHL